jgi:CheY-like chemotaxis protein
LTTILCIDDDRDTLEVRQKVLRSSGYTVLTWQSGMDDLEVLSSGTPVDLVVLDYVMPEMTGDQFAENLKSNFPDLPVIAVSAVRLPTRMLEMVDAYVQKGQDVEVLLSTIERVLSPAALGSTQESLRAKTVLCPDDEIHELLRNAWKYTSNRPTAKIEFGVQTRDGAALYFVRDKESDSIPDPPVGCSNRFSGFTRRRSFPATGLDWQPCRGL